jgi:hypothetical protein
VEFKVDLDEIEQEVLNVEKKQAISCLKTVNLCWKKAPKVKQFHEQKKEHCSNKLWAAASSQKKYINRAKNQKGTQRSDLEITLGHHLILELWNGQSVKSPIIHHTLVNFEDQK